MESPATAPVTELAGSTGFLRATLDCVTVPVWVVDHEGTVLLANPAALAALGFRDASEIGGRNGHETVHYKHLDGSPFPASECSVLEPSRTASPSTARRTGSSGATAASCPSRSARCRSTCRAGAASS